MLLIKYCYTYGYKPRTDSMSPCRPLKKSQFVEQKLSGRPENGHQPTGSLLDAVDKNFRSL